jgi:Transposase, Mutator family
MSFLPGPRGHTETAGNRKQRAHGHGQKSSDRRRSRNSGAVGGGARHRAGVAIGKAQYEVRSAAGREFTDQREGASVEGMSGIRDRDRIEDLIRHCGTVLCAVRPCASTRKVTEVMRELCGLDVSSTQVSRATQLLDEELSRWPNRPLGPVPYVFLDARYEKIRQGGSVVSCAVLMVFGVDESGRRTVLGVSV